MTSQPGPAPEAAMPISGLRVGTEQVLSGTVFIARVVPPDSQEPFEAWVHDDTGAAALMFHGIRYNPEPPLGSRVIAGGHVVRHGTHPALADPWFVVEPATVAGLPGRLPIPELLGAIRRALQGLQRRTRSWCPLDRTEQS